MHAVLLLFLPLPNVGIQNVGTWNAYNLAKAYRSIKNPPPIADSRTGKPAMVTLKIQLDCSTVHDTTLWANIYVRSHLGWRTDPVFIRFCKSHKYIRRKSNANKQGFENTLDLICQSQSTPQTIGNLTNVFCNSGPNVVVETWTGDELTLKKK